MIPDTAEPIRNPQSAGPEQSQREIPDPPQTLSEVEGQFAIQNPKSKIQNPVLGPAAQWLTDNFDDCLKGLIHYGSKAFGYPRKGSAYDFWVIVDDLAKFHSRFTPPANAARGRPLSVKERVRLNEHASNFHGFHLDGSEVKICVIHEDTFCRLCRAKSFYVKGRMQKPLRILRSDERIDRAILDARIEGVRWALDLLPEEFTFDKFLETVLGLSYQTEIRPEILSKKVRSIIETGREELERIYRPLLESVPFVTREGARYRDTRNPTLKQRAEHRARRALRHLRWNVETFQNLYRNYRTYPSPLKYVLKKIVGEARKLMRGT